MPFEAALFEAVVPVFRRIATASRQLRALGMSFEAIARQLGVSEKTVAKSLRN
jgi:biotin operon repressor